MLFYYLRGTITALEAGLAVVDCGGVGYACYTTSYTQSQLKVGQEQKLFTHCAIREDAVDIFGFATKEERTCFERLIGVSGVGPKAALAILSTTTPDRFTLAVVTGDEKALTAAPGVGKKLAQRIILELKDKIAGEQARFDASAGPAAAVMPAGGGGKLAEATAALTVLGYSQSEIGLALRGVDVEQLSVEDIVRSCLRAMVRQ
ncbi:MAG TPA: Holliday junction branch migration protein RuvA [Candidatus Avoscillospira avistercoris]|uniref:Holliday junction branch migration complex subunit RuvA n=1 Tax=Candidatus Avoscillospira avistercoris TaxID=2840707 RepID=A0A9D1F762_9FIRM|nr:Holliday junction branch migration protein RuvA [Candidatus Avoscillospira avistercoris]